MYSMPLYQHNFTHKSSISISDSIATTVEFYSSNSDLDLCKLYFLLNLCSIRVFSLFSSMVFNCLWYLTCKVCMSSISC